MKFLFLWRSVMLVLIGTCLLGCKTEPPAPLYADHEIATKWAEMTTYIMQYTPQNSPTFASRSIGYIGLTMYESIVQGFLAYNSVQSQLNGLPALPQVDPTQEYNWPLALNAGQSLIIKSIYNQTSDSNKMRIDSLELAILNNIKAHLEDKKLVERSIAHGQAVASQIFEWSKSDGGHRSYLRNFDKDYKHPEHPGSWKPPLYAQSFSHHPLHPHWGTNRTFLTENENLPLPEFIPQNTSPSSEYYKQFMAVYEKDKELTQEEKEIALWWGDDPDDTFTPPGHSYYISTLVIKEKKPDLIKSAETYARVGIAVADAFIKCWKWKYHFFSERPNTFIPNHIDRTWESFWPDPPFPAFPSGHAIQAAASTTVLSDLYGEEFEFVDSSHTGRERDEIRDVDFKERAFKTFWAVAEETADSRFFGGIHIEQDNKVGLEEGARIAGNVNQLKWEKDLE